jgi:hypothetical protein
LPLQGSNKNPSSHNIQAAAPSTEIAALAEMKNADCAASAFPKAAAVVTDSPGRKGKENEELKGPIRQPRPHLPRNGLTSHDE